MYRDQQESSFALSSLAIQQFVLIAYLEYKMSQLFH